MVDFQSRDTGRGLDEDDDDVAETDSRAAAGEDEEGSETQDADATEGTPDDDAAAETADGANVGAISIAVLVTDEDAEAAADAVTDALAEDHEVLGRDTRTEDLDAIQTAVATFLDESAVDAVVTVGGVGVGLTQVTVEAVEPLLDVDLPGFGELLRRRYEQRDGSTAVRSRAFAGIAATTPVFCLPADAEAASMAAGDLVGPELEDLVDAIGEP